VERKNAREMRHVGKREGGISSLGELERVTEKED